MHIGLFVGILFVPRDQACMGINYGFSITFLLVSHLLNALRFITNTVMAWVIPLFPDLTFKLYFVEKLLDFFGIVSHILAIIYAQDVYFFNRPQIGSSLECPRNQFGQTHDWLSIEIVIFYANFGANFIFILLSEFLLKDTGLMYLEKRDNKSDFIRKYQTMNGLY